MIIVIYETTEITKLCTGSVCAWVAKNMMGAQISESGKDQRF